MDNDKERLDERHLRERIPSTRITPDNTTVLAKLGLLNELAGRWQGTGFNLIARPNFEDKANLYLQLNTTSEVLKVEPIGSAIPNRGFGQNDIELYGLTYLQQVTATSPDQKHPECRGALHIEPGIWITQPATGYPPETAKLPGTKEPVQLIARMGSIPHGNAVLAQGLAERFAGPPAIKTPGSEYAFSRFKSFNSTPFLAANPVFSAAGSSEKATALAAGVPPFNEYDLAFPEGLANPRTPFKTPCPALPPEIDGVPMQDVINDPARLLQSVIEQQVKDGYTFETTVLNVSTQTKVSFFIDQDSVPTGPTTDVSLPVFAGGTENILFLEGGEPVGAQGPNAQTATVYATFWIEKVMHKHREPFMQLQYAQMVVLNFPIFAALHPVGPVPPSVIVLGWPHISVATLTKGFN